MTTAPADIRELKVFLRLGRRDYDHVAGRIYAACYNDPYVLKKILAADPEDVPSSEVEYDSSDFEGSGNRAEDGDDDDDDDASSRDKKAKSTRASGSKEDPVLLDENSGANDNDKENSLGKRKRATPEVNDDSSQKKSKKGDALLLCLNCGGRFDRDRNKDGVCHYHPEPSVLGELEDNPTCDDISDDEDSRETWPNAFQWECCETNLEEDEPCEKGRHRAEGGERTEYSKRQEKQRQRRRYFG